MRTEHRWSGWPGAWCLDCGEADMREQCLADGHTDDCDGCVNEPCLCPGAAMYDPYLEERGPKE